MRVVGRARKSLRALEECGIELILSGHFHMAYMGNVIVRQEAIERRILVVQASTLSTRRRGEPNAYNIIQCQSSPAFDKDKGLERVALLLGAGIGFHPERRHLGQEVIVQAPVENALGRNLRDSAPAFGPPPR